MKYKKIKIGNYHVHLIKTDKFKTVTLKINLKRKVNKKEITIRRLLLETILQSSRKYPTNRILEMESEDLYALAINGKNYISGSYDVISLTETFLNEKYTEEGMNKRSIEFLLQILLSPNIKDNMFDMYSFDLAKRLLKDNINSFKEYPDSYSVKRMMEHFDKKSPIAYYNTGYIKDLKKITSEDMVDYYKKIMKEDIVDVFVVGDLDEDFVKNIFAEEFSVGGSMTSESHFILNNKIRKKEQVIIEKEKLNQSKLVIGCNFDNITDFELRYVLNILCFILGGSGDSMLFSEVREKHSLCYSISSTYNLTSGILIIKAGIDAKNFEKTLELIKQEIEKMKNGQFSDSDILKAQIIYKNSCAEITDSPDSIINTYLSHEYLNSDLLDEKVAKINSVTKKDVTQLINKMHLNTIYMLEGDLN